MIGATDRGSAGEEGMGGLLAAVLGAAVAVVTPLAAAGQLTLDVSAGLCLRLVEQVAHRVLVKAHFPATDGLVGLEDALATHQDQFDQRLAQGCADQYRITVSHGPVSSLRPLWAVAHRC